MATTVLSLIGIAPGYEIIPDSGVEINGIVDNQTSAALIIQNNTISTQTISNVALDGDLTAAGLTAYFPVGIELPVGQSYQLNFSFLPTEEATTEADVSITTEEGTYRVPFTLVAVSENVLCTIVPTQQTYITYVNQAVATAYNEVVMESNENEGMLSVISSDANITFGSSAYGTSANWKSLINPQTSVVIPMVIQSNVLGSLDATMTWVLTDPQEQRLICQGTFTVRYVCQSITAQVCPLLLQNSLLSVSELRPQDSGTMIATLLLDRDAADIGNFYCSFVLPVSESMFSFVTQEVVTGLTWDDSGINNNPKTLALSVDTSIFVGDSINIILAYDIPSEVTQELYQSLLSVNTIFNNTAFACDGLGFDLFLGVLLTGTSGGFEVQCQTTTLVDCQTISVLDTSDYGADLNHDKEDFSLYREIIITDPSGVDYVYRTHAPYDVLIDPAVSNILSYEVSVASGGVYTVKLTSVPTYSDAGTYNQDDCVCMMYGSELKFFKSLENLNTGNTPVTGVGYEDWWEEVTSDTVTDSYSDTKYYVQWCEINTCMRDIKQSVFCDIQTICNKTICENKCFQSYYKLDVITRMLAEAEAVGYYDKMVLFYNLAKKLCDCSSC